MPNFKTLLPTIKEGIKPEEGKQLSHFGNTTIYWDENVDSTVQKQPLCMPINETTLLIL